VRAGEGRTVPRQHHALFVNSRGAHGASIPADAPPELERYTQFYVAPDAPALTALIKTLPAERRAMWANKTQTGG
jgi:hypothetical protein